MSDSDQTAERQVAGSVTQNVPERKKLEFAPVSGFCASCSREITKRDPVWIAGSDLACSQECSDKLFARWQATIENDEPFEPPRPRMPADPFADVVPHQASSPTSVASAAKNVSTMRSKMERIHNRIIKSGPHGMTRQELTDDLGISLQTVCGRVRRLYQMGLIGSNPGHVRANRISGFENEVLLDELWVDRWTPEQTRPAERPSWERSR